MDNTYSGLTFGEKFKIFMKKNGFVIAVSCCAILLVVALVATVIVKNNKTQSEQPIENVSNNTPIENVQASSGDTLNFVMPLKSYTIGERTFVNKGVVYFQNMNEWANHTGIDFVTQDAEVVMSVADGTVESINQTTLDGTVVVIKHTESLKSVYKSLGGDINLNVGDSVKAGDVIGLTAVSGREGDVGTHLHLEMYESNVAIDPMKYIADK